MKQKKINQRKSRKIATTGMVALSAGLIITGAFAALNDTLTHNESVTIEWVEIVDGSNSDLALEDVNDVTNTPVEELTPGVTYELTGTLENNSSVVTEWTATDMTTTLGMVVKIGDVNGDDTPTAAYEDVDVAQFDITVQVEDTITPSTPINFVLEFNASDARDYVAPPTLAAPTAINMIFPDPALATCVANDDEVIAYTGGDVNYVISQDELNNITYLNCSNKGISNIEGIQYLNNVVKLYLENNNITDISQIAYLENVNYLVLRGNNISDLTPLAGLENIMNLYLDDNNITDITPLADLENLALLEISHNQISDISALSNLTNLKTVDLSYNLISDLTPLTNATKILNLTINNNQITDFSPLMYQAPNFIADTQTIVLPDGMVNTPTVITIDGVNGTDLILDSTSSYTYVDGQLTWTTAGTHTLTYASSDGTISGTITQTVY